MENLQRLTTAELLKIHAALFPHSPVLKFWHHYPKSKLVERLESMAAELPESEVFTSPTAGALIVALLEHKISHEDISKIVKRRFPTAQASPGRVRRIEQMLKRAA